MSVITTIEQLEAVYGFPGETSTLKVADRITLSYRVLIEKSPFAVGSTGPGFTVVSTAMCAADRKNST